MNDLRTITIDYGKFVGRKALLYARINEAFPERTYPEPLQALLRAADAVVAVVEDALEESENRDGGRRA